MSVIDPVAELGRRVSAACEAAFAAGLDDPLIRPSGERFAADFQSNAAMVLAGRLGLPSREVAARIVAHLDCGGVVAEPEVTGPGFINFVLRRQWIEDRCEAMAADPRLGVPAPAAARRVVVDYSSPNVAKEMHVGHLRSTIIGDAIVRLLSWVGHDVVRRNHVGDWGTPFGMLIEHLVDERRAAGGLPSIADLNDFYQEARRKFESDPAFAARARRRVVALQGGDDDTLSLWRELVAESERHFEAVYDMLGVLITRSDGYGESFYNPLLEDTIAELEAKGLTTVSDGALCIFLDGFGGRDGEPVPLIVRKQDGGYTYGTTDLAAIRYWACERDRDHLVYVVGAPQQLHLEMVFAAARRAGWLDPGREAVHVAFGSVLGEDGKMLRTRRGRTVKLASLLSEAIERAAGAIADRSELSERERAEVAPAIGIGAVKYADLSSDRRKDYVFSIDRMLSLEGNTSVYLQYANARVRSVVRRAGRPPSDAAPIVIEHDAERALAMKLLMFPSALDTASSLLEPHRLCTYLYEAAVSFSTFYESCPILKAPRPEVRESRLRLCELTSRVIVRGLDLLGIAAPDRL